MLFRFRAFQYVTVYRQCVSVCVNMSSEGFSGPKSLSFYCVSVQVDCSSKLDSKLSRGYQQYVGVLCGESFSIETFLYKRAFFWRKNLIPFFHLHNIVVLQTVSVKQCGCLDFLRPCVCASLSKHVELIKHSQQVCFYNIPW